MILLDTNVLSEVMRSRPAPEVVAWLDAQPAGSLWTTSVTVFEVEFGLRKLEPGKRRNKLAAAFKALLDEDLERRVLAFDLAAAIEAGRLSARFVAEGCGVEIRDVQIASIALARKAKVATRNVRHFEGRCEVVDPWTGVQG